MSAFEANASNSMLLKFGDLQGRPCCKPRSSPAPHLAGVHFALGFALGTVLGIALGIVSGRAGLCPHCTWTWNFILHLAQRHDCFHTGWKAREPNMRASLAWRVKQSQLDTTGRIPEEAGGFSPSTIRPLSTKRMAPLQALLRPSLPREGFLADNYWVPLRLCWVSSNKRWTGCSPICIGRSRKDLWGGG